MAPHWVSVYVPQVPTRAGLKILPYSLSGSTDGCTTQARRNRLQVDESTKDRQTTPPVRHGLERQQRTRRVRGTTRVHWQAGSS